VSEVVGQSVKDRFIPADELLVHILYVVRVTEGSHPPLGARFIPENLSADVVGKKANTFFLGRWYFTESREVGGEKKLPLRIPSVFLSK